MALSGSLNFLSASEIGTFEFTAAPGIRVYSTVDVNPSVIQNIIYNDFVGLNTNIVEPIAASDNLLGNAGSDIDVNSYAGGHNPHPDADAVSVAGGHKPYMLNGILHHRNGPYQHPSWKQYRGGDHPIARQHRLHNTMSIDVRDPNPILKEKRKKVVRNTLEYATFSEVTKFYNNLNLYLQSLENKDGAADFFKTPQLERFYEPSVVIKHKPILYDVSEGVQSIGGFNDVARVRASFMNQMTFFENQSLNESMKIAGTFPITSSFQTDFSSPKQQYYSLLKVAKQYDASRFVYSQMIFPKSVNVFRPYKLEKPNFEEAQGYEDLGYDRIINRSFWRDNQPSLGSHIENTTDPDTYSRLRTDGQAFNSQEMLQHINASKLWYDAGGINFVGFSDGSTSTVNGLRLWKGTTSNGAPAFDVGTWCQPEIYFIEGGVIAERGINSLSGSATSNPIGSDNLPSTQLKAAYVNHETYNPYPPSLLSMWPLDARPDLFDGALVAVSRGTLRAFSQYTPPVYLTSSHGGKGMQIGLTPHRMKEYDILQTPSDNPFVTTNSVFTASHNFSETNVGSLAGTFYIKHNLTSSYDQFIEIQTGSAGELAYSTKPTIFFHRTSSYAYFPKGYHAQTASMQYNRHTFPYNTPFYATNQVRQRNPMFNSYADFSKDIKYLSREYSFVPEYRVSDNIEFYYNNYFNDRGEDPLYKNSVEARYVDSNSTTPGGSGPVAYTATDSTIMTIIKRNFTLGIPPANPAIKELPAPATKLDFLRLEGVFGVTSSAAVTTFETASLSLENNKYNVLEMKAEAETLDFKARLFSQDSGSLEFYERFGHTENLKEFSSILDTPFTFKKDTVPSKITIKVEALKKLLPNKNFYPATKTVQIGNNFKSFIYDFIIGFDENSGGGNSQPWSEDRSPGRLQAFLEPLFAPGVLYNSIKSGIAVSYPVYTIRNPCYFAPLPFVSGGLIDQGAGTSPQYKLNYPNGFPHTDYRFSHHISSSFNYGGFYMMGACRAIPAILNTAPDFEVDFEFLYKPELFSYFGKMGIYLTSDFLDLDTNTPDAAAMAATYVDKPSGRTGTGPLDQFNHHPGAAIIRDAPRAFLEPKDLTQVEGNSKKEMYKASINNYLCETMNFFLEDQDVPGVKLPIFTSKLVDTKPNLNPNMTYYMEVSLRMGKDQVNCEGPRNAGVGGGSIANNLHANDNLYASMRGYIYGPPIEIVQMSGSTTTTEFTVVKDDETGVIKSITEPYIASHRNGMAAIGANDSYIGGHGGDYESYFAANLQDPAYQAFTPPYFYGKSSRIVTVNPSSVDSTFNNIFYDASAQSFHLEEYITGSGSPLTPSTDKLCKVIPGTSSISAGSFTRMKINKSVDILSNAYMKVSKTLEAVASDDRYMMFINPKWVCPVLDFSSSFSAIQITEEDPKTRRSESLYTVITNSFHSNETGKGLWGGYGTDPYDYKAMNTVKLADGINRKLEKGIYIEIQDPFANEQGKRTTKSTFNPGGLVSDSGFYLQQGGETATETQDRVAALFDTAREVAVAESGLSLPSVTGSLAKEFGFIDDKKSKVKKKIGAIADSKAISEAIVVIPYLEERIHIQPATLGFTADNKYCVAQGDEIYSTREIISGKHFLPIQKGLFENLLSMNLVMKKAANESPHLDPILSLISAFQPESSGKKYVGFESKESVNSAYNTDVWRMIDLLLGDEKNNKAGYELPPEFDFINYQDVSPFQMFVVPVHHTLKKQELIDIYQGIMPQSSLSAEKSYNNFFSCFPSRQVDGEYSWMPRCRFENAAAPLNSLQPQNFLSPAFIKVFENNLYMRDMEPSTSVNPGYTTGVQTVPAIDKGALSNNVWPENSQEFYKNIKFMVFKIKQKAFKDYDGYKNRQISRTIRHRSYQEYNSINPNGYQGSFDYQNPGGPIGETVYDLKLKDVFGYNWPYDDFSLVESARIDIEAIIDE